MTPALELAQELAATAVTGPFGGDGDFSVHVSREPMAPADVVTLYDTGGSDLIDVEEQLRRPSVQVRVRSSSYDAGYAMQQAIFEALSIPNERQIGAHWYVAVDLVGDILAIGRDDNDRFLLTANYLIERQPMGPGVVFSDNFDSYAHGAFVASLPNWEEKSNILNTLTIDKPAADGAVRASANANAWAFPKRSLFTFANDQFAEATIRGGFTLGTASLGVRFHPFFPPILSLFATYQLRLVPSSGTWSLFGMFGPPNVIRPVLPGTRVRFEARGYGPATRVSALIDEGAGFVPISPDWIDLDPIIYLHEGTPALSQLTNTAEALWDDFTCGDLID